MTENTLAIVTNVLVACSRFFLSILDMYFTMPVMIPIVIVMTLAPMTTSSHLPNLEMRTISPTLTAMLPISMAIDSMTFSALSPPFFHLLDSPITPIAIPLRTTTMLPTFPIDSQSTFCNNAAVPAMMTTSSANSVIAFAMSIRAALPFEMSVLALPTIFNINSVVPKNIAFTASASNIVTGPNNAISAANKPIVAAIIITP